MTDVISSLLDMMRVRGTAYVSKNLELPWSMQVEEHVEMARFHLVLSGSTWIDLPNSDRSEQLHKGDFVIVPNGQCHVLSDQVGRPKIISAHIPDVDLGPDFESFDRNAKNPHVLCGYFQISGNTPPTILTRLPSIMIERAGIGQKTNKNQLITELLRHELAHQAGPAPHVLNRLTEILCLYAIHNWLECALAQDMHLGALADPKLHLVLDEINANPARAWSVEDLARIYGQSRTGFAARFKAAMGMTPINYVTELRMKLACTVLQETDLSLDALAERMGYVDTNAFGRAFKRVTHTAPATYRRMSRK